MLKKRENIYHRKDGRWEGRYIYGRKPDGRPKCRYVYGSSYSEAKIKLEKIRKEYESASEECCSYKDILRDDIYMSGRVADIVVLKYAETEPEIMEFRPGWHKRLRAELAEKAADACMTVSDLYDKWMASKLECGMPEREADKWSDICMCYILPVMGDVLCIDIDRQHVELAAIRMMYRKESSGEPGRYDFMLSIPTARIQLNVLNDLLEYGYQNGYIPSKLRVQVNIRDAWGIQIGRTADKI